MRICRIQTTGFAILHVPPPPSSQECLEDNIDESGFSADCKEELDNIIAKRVADFKLDTPLREACEGDLQDMCAVSLKAMDDDNKVKVSALNCLQQYKEELKSETCKAEVHRRMQRASRDIRFDEVLANACFDDRAKFCNDVQMVRGGGELQSGILHCNCTLSSLMPA